MPTEPWAAPVQTRPDASAGRRLHIHGIKEMPAGYDAEVAELFRDLRAASNLSETDLAMRLATRPEVVQALEAGALYALPPWGETCRVVTAYGTLLNLDVRPLLRRIYVQVEAGIIELRPKPMPEMPSMSPPDIEREFQGQRRGAAVAAPFPAVPPSPAPPRRGPPDAVADRRTQPRPAQAQAPQPRPAPPEPAPAQTRQPQKARPRPSLLKWGIAALLVSVAAFGLWMMLAQPGLLGSLGSSSSPSGSETSNPAAPPVLDPDDPRSRKADRLPQR
jgi:hypothetical protein